MIKPMTPRSARANPKICRPALAISPLASFCDDLPATGQRQRPPAAEIQARPSADFAQLCSSFAGSLRLFCYRRAYSWAAGGGEMAGSLIRALSGTLSRHLLLRRTSNRVEAAGASFLGGFCRRWAGTRTQFRLITCGAKNTWSIVTSLLPEAEPRKRLWPPEKKVLPMFSLNPTAEPRYVACKDLFVGFNENTSPMCSNLTL